MDFSHYIPRTILDKKMRGGPGKVERRRKHGFSVFITMNKCGW